MEQGHCEDMRGAPIGRDDFKRIRDMGLLYVDKTGVVTFNVTSPPKTLFFDGMGNLAAEVNGLCRAETIRETLDGMLEK